MLTLNVDSQGERGLLGVAPHPNFASNGFVYVYYTTTSGRHAQPHQPLHGRAATTRPGSEVRSSTCRRCRAPTNHNGGALHFGNDGKLYVAVGDNADSTKAPDLDDPFGKMLRFNDDGSIPSDNPFCTTAGNLRLRDLGPRPAQPVHLRRARQRRPHPHQRRRPGHVGGDQPRRGRRQLRLAVDRGPDQRRPASPRRCSPTTTTARPTSPAGFFGGCSIIGGAFYPDSGPFPQAYRGSYYFTDYCSRG